MFHKRIRAWHKKQKSMGKVLELDFQNEKATIMGALYGQNREDVIIADFEDLIIMQESGMQDNAGFNVFQGDLIKWEDEIFVLMYGDFGDTITGVNGYGWHLAGKCYTFIYVGGGEKIGNTFENTVVEK